MRNSLRLMLIGAAIVACVLAAVSTMDAGERGNPFTNAPKTTAFKANGDGSRATLQYDDGVRVSRDPATGPNYPLIGNQFSPGLPTGAHTITAVSFNLAGYWPPAAVLGMFGPAAGTTAPVLGIQVLSGVTGTGWWSAAIPSIAAGSGSFLAGIVNSTYATCTSTALSGSCEGVALGPGTNGYGHNAMRISITGSADTAGSGFATIPGQNAFIRVTGPNIPVELMRFVVE